jgi:hypothetical protein
MKVKAFKFKSILRPIKGVRGENHTMALIDQNY